METGIFNVEQIDNYKHRSSQYTLVMDVIDYNPAIQASAIVAFENLACAHTPSLECHSIRLRQLCCH